ncbi:hypothetical protein JCM9534A_11390 [Catenuloplanes indicus JCM 9534]
MIDTVSGGVAAAAAVPGTSGATVARTISAPSARNRFMTSPWESGVDIAPQTLSTPAAIALPSRCRRLPSHRSSQVSAG